MGGNSSSPSPGFKSSEKESEYKGTGIVMGSPCNVCLNRDVSVFFELRDVPVSCNVVCDALEEAAQQPRGDITLAWCRRCGHIFNSAFDPELFSYDARYDTSLYFSPRFREYAASAVDRLVKKYRLYGRNIVEIGCGSGDFLRMICEAGGNRGVGFDKSYSPNKGQKDDDAVRFINDYFSVRYRGIPLDFVVCRHVLEHVHDPRSFLSEIKDAVEEKEGVVLFFEVPNASYLIDNLFIWDIIYEHCSYFTEDSIRFLFGHFGFDPIEMREEFDGQYLTTEVIPLPSRDGSRDVVISPHRIEKQGIRLNKFRDEYMGKVASWKEEIGRMAGERKRVVVWGGGSKGVTFLNAIASSETIQYVVDLNANKQGKFIPGSAQKIVPPDSLKDLRPDIVLVMNPIYRSEIETMLSRMSVNTELIYL